MNYIGSKYSLIGFLTESIDKTLASHKETRAPGDMVFADLFAGTGAVSAAFRERGYRVVANDIQYFSYITLRHLLENGAEVDTPRMRARFDELNALPGCEGFLYRHYTAGGTAGGEHCRMYFSDENGKRCDAMRMRIEDWKRAGEITEGEYAYLLASLINSIDKYANTASVYGAFLKQLKRSAQRQMVLTPMPIIIGSAPCRACHADILSLIGEVSGDILYLDPPYNTRQYCTNYHLLETIARYDDPTVFGKTGLREYADQKSVFCIRDRVEEAFARLIDQAKFRYVFLSYNNEGLMSFDTIEKIMRRHGKYKVYMTEYHRFKADNKRDAKADNTVEYLHCLTKA